MCGESGAAVELTHGARALRGCRPVLNIVQVKLAGVIGVLLLVVPISAGAWTDSISLPFEDTKVISRSPDQNFVTDSTLEVADGGKYGDAISLIMPDLSMIRGGAVSSASFEITRIRACKKENGWKSHDRVTLNPILEDWNPSEVTWQTRPAIGDPVAEPFDGHIAAAATSGMSGTSGGDVTTYDITDLVNAWLGDDDQPDFGFAITMEAETCHDKNKYGSLDGSAWSRPEIRIRTIPEPGTHLLVAIGVCALGVPRRRSRRRR